MPESTIKDVAKKAKVSISTVSRVMSGKGGVAAETRQKVLQAIESLNYKPNLIARSLKEKRSHTLGLIVENMNTSFCLDMLRGAQEKAEEHGFDIFLCDNRKDFNRCLSHLDALKKRGVDGIIYSSVGKFIKPMLVYKIMQLSEAGLPIVLTWRGPEGINTPMVFNDEVDAVYKATEHLLQQGYRRIGFLGGFQDSSITGERYDGYCLALENNGLPLDSSLVTYADFEVEGGKLGALELLQKDSPPDAIFAANDLMAIGTLMAAKKLGKRVPQDLAIMGCDGIDATEYTEPSLSTVSIPRYQIGVKAVEKILEILEGKEISGNGNIKLKSRLLIRDSCRKCAE